MQNLSRIIIYCPEVAHGFVSISPDNLKYEIRWSSTPFEDTRPTSGLFGSATIVRAVVRCKPFSADFSPGNGVNSARSRSSACSASFP